MSLGLSVSAFAGVSESEAARLDSDLTPMGAERAGNAAGTIPAWTGGLSTPPANVTYSAGDHHADPFADDPILFTITPENAASYAENMTVGQLEIMDAYDTYKMNVYASRRSCAFPESIYAANRQNAVNARLVAGGNGVDGALLGTPFPIPSEGVEVVWNHNLRYRGHKLTRQFSAFSPSFGGGFTAIVVRDQVIFTYADPAKEAFADLNNISLKYMQTVISPARRAGEIILVHDTINQVEGPRNAWSYSPGTRRVRRAPTIAYDNPQSYSDGLQTADNFDLFNGSPDRYTWELLGKFEKYIAYNSYRLGSDALTYEQIAQERHIDQDLVRYELHRVWQVEGKLRENQRHIYNRRVKYFDEDSWTMAAADLYDARGELWRIQEAHIIQYYDVPTCFNGSEMVYDLIIGRYTIQGLKNQEPMINFFADELDESQFTPSGVRASAAR
ncbi:MAG: outer membrane lipoprotein-sorting protein [Rhodobiaceae bacterium]|nr:MAG: outer membrane lipoprotein-sorting protein [Rhodobiaceae bacterium]